MYIHSPPIKKQNVSEKLMNVNAITRLPPKAPGKGIKSENGCIYFQDDKLGLTVGLWEAEPSSTDHVVSEVDEFFRIIDGSATIELANGDIEEITAGQSFVIPKGLSFRWVQNVKMRAFYMRHKKSETALNNTVDAIGIIRLDSSDPIEEISIADTSQFLGVVPKHFKHDYYKDAANQFLVAMWNSDPFERDVAPFNRHELMCILAGSVTLSDGADYEETFKAGDVIFVPFGAPYKWKSSEYLSKFYCIVMPN